MRWKKMAKIESGGSGMLTRAEAAALAERHVREIEGDGRLSLRVCTECTREEDFGWVFFWDSVKFEQTFDLADALAGNAPFIIDKHSGEIVGTGTAGPIEPYIESYRKHKDPFWHFRVQEPPISDSGSILMFVKRAGSHGVRGEDIAKHWESEGRGAGLYILLGELVKEKKLLRKSSDNERDRRY